MSDETKVGEVAARPAPPLAHAWTLVKDLRWWADQIEKRSPVTPWELGLISLLQKAAYELEKAGPAPPLADELKRFAEAGPAPLAEGAPRDWQPIDTAPKDGTVVIGALVMDGRIWRVSDMKHNGLAFYTANGGSLPRMTHWMPLPAPPPQENKHV